MIVLGYRQDLELNTSHVRFLSCSIIRAIVAHIGRWKNEIAASSARLCAFMCATGQRRGLIDPT